MRKVEVYYGYYSGDSQLWDSEYVDIPADTPEDRIEEVALAKFSKPDIAFKGVLCIPPLDDELNEEENDWIENHSVNCIKCGELVDERDCVRHKVEGEMCEECAKKYPNEVEE